MSPLSAKTCPVTRPPRPRRPACVGSAVARSHTSQSVSRAVKNRPRSTVRMTSQLCSRRYNHLCRGNEAARSRANVSTGRRLVTTTLNPSRHTHTPCSFSSSCTCSAIPMQRTRTHRAHSRPLACFACATSNTSNAHTPGSFSSFARATLNMPHQCNAHTPCSFSSYCLRNVIHAILVQCTYAMLLFVLLHDSTRSQYREIMTSK